MSTYATILMQSLSGIGDQINKHTTKIKNITARLRNGWSYKRMSEKEAAIRELSILYIKRTRLYHIYQDVKHVLQLLELTNNHLIQSK